MSEVPTLAEEIERKAIETLEMIELDHQHGRISGAQYAYASTVLWNTVAGLVGGEITVMMEIMGDKAKLMKGTTAELYAAPNGKIVRIANLHDGRVMIEKGTIETCDYQSEVIKDFRDTPTPHQEAKRYFQNVADKLLVSGFSQL